MLTLEMILEFLRVMWAINTKVISAKFYYVDENGYGRSYDEFFDLSQEIFFFETDHTIIEKMAGSLGIGIDAFKPENFSFSNFTKNLFSEEIILEANKDIHNRLTHYSVIDLPNYFNPEILFPRFLLAEKYLKYDENISESKAIDQAFSKKEFIPEIHIDGSDPPVDCYSFPSYSLANKDVLKVVCETVFVKLLKEKHPNFIENFSDNLLGEIYPHYKTIIKNKMVVKAFSDEFTLARYMCLKGLAEVIYVYLYELSVGVNNSNSDLIFMDIIKKRKALEKSLLELSSHETKINGLSVDSTRNYNGGLNLSLIRLELHESILGLLKRNNDDYIIVKSVSRISYNIFSLGLRSVSAIKIIVDFMRLIEAEYSNDSIKYRVEEYKKWFFYNGKIATEFEDSILSTEKLIYYAYGKSRIVKGAIKEEDEPLSAEEILKLDVEVQKLIDSFQN